MKDSSEDENQPCSSKKTQSSRKSKNVQSPLLEDNNAFHNPNDELLPFCEITGPVRNTPQAVRLKKLCHILSYFLVIKSSKNVVLETNRYQN